MYFFVYIYIITNILICLAVSENEICTHPRLWQFWYRKWCLASKLWREVSYFQTGPCIRKVTGFPESSIGLILPYIYIYTFLLLLLWLLLLFLFLSTNYFYYYHYYCYCHYVYIYIILYHIIIYHIMLYYIISYYIIYIYIISYIELI